MQFSTLSITNGAGSAPELALPLFQMPSLRSLALHNVAWKPVTAASATATAATATAAVAQPLEQPSAPLSSSFRQQGLQPLTALTSLQLTGSSVRLAGLSALTALQALRCDGIDPETTAGQHQFNIPALKTVEADLIAAFPQLHRLTKLKLLRVAASTAVVKHVSLLQSLQQLMLDKASANSFPQLPPSLTYLYLVPKQPCSMTRSNAAGLSQLTALQHLGLSAQVLDMSLLTSMRSLHTLQLWSTAVAPGQLQVISRLTGLTSILLNVTRPPQEQSPATISVAEAGALTSSNQLVRLSLSSEAGGPLLQDFASLFPPGRQLQHLTRLRLGADFLRDTAAVQQAGSCCPNLRKAKFGKSGRVQGGAG